MNIQGLDYNTQRERLVMTEYGREIQKMVDHAITLPTKQERLRCAKAIVKLMESRNPQIRETNNYQQTLWDHLYIMSRQQLDIDWPYDISQAETIHSHPQPLQHPTRDGQNHLRHYGRLLTELFERLKQMEPGAERDELARLTANQMRRDQAAWGQGMASEERIVSDLARLTDGKIQLDMRTFRFERLNAAPQQQPTGKKKRKK